MTINSTPIVAESSSEAGQPPRPKLHPDLMLSIMFELMSRNQRLIGEKEDMKNELTKSHREIIKKDEELARREGRERRRKEERERPALPSLDLEEDIGRIRQQHGLDVFSAGRRWNWGDPSSIASSTESLDNFKSLSMGSPRGPASQTPWRVILEYLEMRLLLRRQEAF
ncbi:hypothetical protein FOZ60_005897 [Perkinsus olseni]|uniref:Uncharacterized protein n=1 Tax=Perkinsus olseni TaxID=32597 RepID=A0A7J6NQ50_PEROL|nr:hypothetical protein FOZ60_005897 [Perkinsus olseni]